MPTKAQIEANRRNALKSTGPRTPEGKHRSSLNSLVHGFCAEDASLQDDFETAAEIQQRIDDYLDFHQPEDPLERDALIDAAVARVRLNRVLRAESGLLNNARQFVEATTRYTGRDGEVVVVHDLNRFHPDRRRAASNKHLAESWQHIKADLDLLSRYESRVSRRLQHAIKNLQSLKQAGAEAGRQRLPAHQPAPHEAPRKPAAQAATPQNQISPNEPNFDLTKAISIASGPPPEPDTVPAITTAGSPAHISAASDDNHRSISQPVCRNPRSHHATHISTE